MHSEKKKLDATFVITVTTEKLCWLSSTDKPSGKFSRELATRAFIVNFPNIPVYSL